MANKEIENVFCCYFLPSVLHSHQCCVNTASVVANDCKNECNPAQPFLSSISLQHPANNSAIVTNSDESLKTLLNEFKDVFPADLPQGLPPEHGMMHAIELAPGTKPLSRPPYRLSANEAREVEQQLADLVQ